MPIKKIVRGICAGLRVRKAFKKDNKKEKINNEKNFWSCHFIFWASSLENAQQFIGKYGFEDILNGQIVKFYIEEDNHKKFKKRFQFNVNMIHKSDPKGIFMLPPFELEETEE